MWTPQGLVVDRGGGGVFDAAEVQARNGGGKLIVSPELRVMSGLRRTEL